MAQIVNKKVSLKLAGVRWEAWFLTAAFRRQARDELWTEEEIDQVLSEAKSKDHEYLLATVGDHCVTPSAAAF